MSDLPDSIGTIARQSAAAADVELDSSELQAEFHIADTGAVVECSPCTDCPSSFPFATADCITAPTQQQVPLSTRINTINKQL